MDFTIRKLQKTDIKDAAEVFFLSFNSVGEKWSRETAEKRLEQYFDPDYCWVAENNDKIIGVLTSKLDNVLDHQELYIDVLAVDPEFHKSGIGSRLLQTAENCAKSKGLNSVWLTASPDLNSYAWYLKIGFRETNWKVLVKDFE